MSNPLNPDCVRNCASTPYLGQSDCLQFFCNATVSQSVVGIPPKAEAAADAKQHKDCYQSCEQAQGDASFNNCIDVCNFPKQHQGIQ